MTIEKTKRIDQAKLRRYGASESFVLRLPRVFTNDNNLRSDEEIDIYREIINGVDALVLIPLKSNGINNNNQS